MTTIWMIYDTETQTIMTAMYAFTVEADCIEVVNRMNAVYAPKDRFLPKTIALI